MNNQNPPKISEMMQMFRKMTRQQRDHVFRMLNGKIPSIDIAYRAANNIEKYKEMDSEFKN